MDCTIGYSTLWHLFYFFIRNIVEAQTVQKSKLVVLKLNVLHFAIIISQG